MMNGYTLGLEFTFLLKHLPTKSYCVQFWTKRICNSIHLSKSSFFSKLSICFIVLYFIPEYSCFIVKYLHALGYSYFYNHFLVDSIMMLPTIIIEFYVITTIIGKIQKNNNRWSVIRHNFVRDVDMFIQAKYLTNQYTNVLTINMNIGMNWIQLVQIWF